MNSNAEVKWTVTGGTLSATSGFHVTYTPPPGSGSGSVTATAGELTATVMIMSKPVELTSATIPNLTAPVTVQYDAQDIPHVKCAHAIDCIAVQGYLQAHDRLFPMDFLRHVAEGRVAELVGPDGLNQDVQLRTAFTTRDGKRVQDELEVKLASDATTQKLLIAFAAGVNAYIDQIKSNAAPLPAEYAQLPFRVDPTKFEAWKVSDTLALSRFQQFQLSETLTEEMAFGQFAKFFGLTSGRAIAWLRAASPPTERAHTLETTPFQPPAGLAQRRAPRVNYSKWSTVIDGAANKLAMLHDQLLPADGSVGSNNWVVSADKSATGFPMVANDPHLSLQYPPLFHLATLTSSDSTENLDLTGGTFPGIPGALVGRGAHVAWGVTVVGYDVTDIYLESLDVSTTGCAPQVPCVKFKGGVVPMTFVPATFKVITPAGLKDAVKDLQIKGVPPGIFVVPHHGPVVQLDVPTLTAASFRWTGHEGNTQDVKAVFGLNTAASVDAAVLALKGFSTGAQNFVLADDLVDPVTGRIGHIAYDPHALVPARKFAALAPGKIPWLPLDGVSGSSEWGDGVHNCAAAGQTPLDAACWISDDELPFGKDPAKGYFFTANADPLGVSDDNDPLNDKDTQGNPLYLSFAWDDSSGFRATRIEQLIEAGLAAGGGKLSLKDMEAIQSDHVSRLGALVVPIVDAIIGTPSATTPPELALGKTVLDTWAAAGFDCPSGLVGTDPVTSPVDTNKKVVDNSSGCFLFHEFMRVLLSRVFTDDLKAAGQGVNGLLAVKAMLFMLGPGSPDQSFCNDADAKGDPVVPHTCAEQVAIALGTAVKTLSTLVGPQPEDWVWGRHHTVKPVSLLALVTNGFSPGPYARPGGLFTVDVGNPNLASAGTDFQYFSGGNVRHISVMDPSRPVVRMQLPGPERDGPTVTLGPDLLGQWVRNSYFDYAAGNQIDGVTVATQSFKAP
ncbi:MAG TPA: penicillin acylase family protein [Kofleriaceae bacterium]|nr:penicillin acylase family protein [Kofleriaceae bacterium]